MRYILFNKPYGVLASPQDVEGRPAVGTYVPLAGLEAAGRLDLDSEGLMLLTDDGALAHRLTHPAHHLSKTYLVQVEGTPNPQALQALREGVRVKNYVTAPAQVALLITEPELPPRPTPIQDRPRVATTWLRLILREGRKRQIRHMTAAVGHPTLRLVRVAIGPLTLDGLAPGEWRALTPGELARLRRALGWH
jgi:23S rRNA pseudouridine2457 synthase